VKFGRRIPEDRRGRQLAPKRSLFFFYHCALRTQKTGRIDKALRRLINTSCLAGSSSRGEVFCTITRDPFLHRPRADAGGSGGTQPAFHLMAKPDIDRWIKSRLFQLKPSSRRRENVWPHRCKGRRADFKDQCPHPARRVGGAGRDRIAFACDLCLRFGARRTCRRPRATFWYDLRPRQIYCRHGSTRPRGMLLPRKDGDPWF
jgi:hypothetical protein